MKSFYQIRVLENLIVVAFLFCAGVAQADAKIKLKVGKAEDGRKAVSVLNDVFSAYSNGDTLALREKLDPKMIGFQNLLDNVTTETNNCKQLRFNLKDTQVQAAPDVVVIQTTWEKRCLLLPNMVPQLVTGHSTFLLQPGAGSFSVTGISGASPFQPTTNSRVTRPPTLGP